MDAYTEDVHPQSKGFLTDLSTNRLSSLERDTEEAQPHFEPLEVQLRFELGSLVDTQVLIDTDGPRESDWDFMRQEQGRFQQSSEDSNVLLSHGKQDESFVSCENWPRTRNQVDTRIFIDAQDDVTMITEAFAGKDKSLVDVVEDDRGFLVTSINRQCKEETSWSGGDKQAVGEKALESFRDDVVEGTVEVSQISVVKSDSTVDGKNCSECSESQLALMEAHKENNQAELSIANVSKELSPKAKGTRAAETIPGAITVSKSHSTMKVGSSKDGNHDQEGLLEFECDKRCVVETIESRFSNDDNLEKHINTNELQADDVEVLCASEGNLKMDSPRAETSIGKKMFQISDLAGTVGNNHLIERVTLADEPRGLSLEAVSQPLSLVMETCMVRDTNKSIVILGGSCLDSKPGGSSPEAVSVSADGSDKQNCSTVHYSGISSKLQETPAVGTGCVPVSESSVETAVLSTLEATSPKENVAGNNLDKETKILHEISDLAGNTSPVNRQVASSPSASELPQNILSAATIAAKVCAEGDETFLAARVLEHTDSYKSCTERHENDDSVTGLEKAGAMQGSSAAAKFGMAETSLSQIEITRGELQASKDLCVPGCHGELEAVDNRVSHEHMMETVVNPRHSNESSVDLSNKVESPKQSLEKHFMAHDRHKDAREETGGNNNSKFQLQEQKIEQPTTDKNAIDFSQHSSKTLVSDESKFMTDNSHAGGILHVLLDVHKERITNNSLQEKTSAQDHLRTIEVEGSLDAQVSDPRDITRQEYGTCGAKVAVGCSDSYVVSGSAQVAQEVSQKDASPIQKNSEKGKTDLVMRDSRSKDSPRPSPIQLLCDEEQKNGGAEASRRRKATPKSTSQKKYMNSIENLTSCKKPGSKGFSGSKKLFSPIVQERGKEISQMPAVSIDKTVFPGNVRHHVLSDMNGLEIAVPLSAQPFSEPQQVQLRAQILVYGSLIQGAAPEEALMIAAFSNVGGGHIEKASEISERAIWEKQWQAAVDRIRPKSSRDSFIARANLALVSNSPVATARAAEGGSKPNGSSGMTSMVIDNNRPTGLLARPLDVSGTKGQDSRVRHQTDSVHDVSVSSRQTMAAATPLGSVIATASRAVSSMLTESYSQTPKPRLDSQQMTPQPYFPAPSLGPFITGAPQWFSTTALPGSWMLQNQNTAYANPSFFAHAHAAAMPGQISCSSGTVMPANTSSTTLFTPVVGSLSVTPTPRGDPLLTTKQAVSESRPRKRKKTETEYGSSTDMNLSHAIEFTPAADAPATSTQSQMQTGLACSGITNPVHSPLPSAPETLAVIVASTQLSKSSQETSLAAVPVDKILVSCSNDMPSANVLSARSLCNKSIDLLTSADHLSQAQASAEEAASAAASALMESDLVWSQLKAQKSLGSISDTESRLVSSAIAVATAASVAKAAAAAAKAAFEAAAQAKRMSERVMEAGKLASEGSKLLVDKAETASQTCGMPESFSSILNAAKMASKKRLEAVSAARARAENFESVVRAAEIAANSITQVGSIMAMGESVPFTLDMLLEAGPEGLLRLEDKTRTKTKGTVLRLPPTSGTPKSLDREKKFPFKISSIDEVASQGDAHGKMDSWASDNIITTRPESDTRISTELGVESVTDLNKQKAADHLGLSVITRTENGLTEQDNLVADDQIVKGSLVEVMSDEKGLRGVWFSARVQSLDEEKVFVLYDDLLADDGYSPLEEWIQITGSSGEAPRVRLAHPNTHIGFEGTRKRRREAMGSHRWSVGDRIDAWIRDGWWEGEIQEIIEDGESKAKIFFPGDGDTSIVKMSKLRPSLVWNNGHWVLWNDVKKESSRGRIDVLEGDTPFAKRQKSEKVQASAMKQKLILGNSADILAASHIEENPFDSNMANLATDFKGLTAEGIPKARLQTSKIVFGIPRPTKKRKLIEVSKHFGSARGVSGAGALDAKASNNRKTENPSIFVPGPADMGTIDVSKAKKRILYQPKAQPQKDTSTDINASGKKEKTVLSSKTILRKNSSNKDEIPMLSKNKEVYSIKKKNIPSENNHFESRERSEAKTFCSKVESLAQSISCADVDKESSLATQDMERQNNVGHESGREIFQATHITTSGNQTSSNRVSNKEKAKRPAQQSKKGDIKSSAPASCTEAASQSTNKREHSPSKDNEKTVRKGSESQPNQEGEKRPEASGKKQSANPLINSEKQSTHSTKESEKDKEVGKPVPETWEPRRTSRKIQPTSKLLEGLQTAPKLGKSSSFHDRGHKGASKAPSHV